MVKFFAVAHTAAILLLLSSIPAFGQRIAILAPDNSERTERFADELGTRFPAGFKVLDRSLADAAFGAAGTENPFNMTREDSKRVAAAVGCDFLVLLRSDSLRRSSFSRAKYFEANAVVYVVSARTGRLVFWKLQKFEEDSSTQAEKRLFDSVGDFAGEIASAVSAAQGSELNSPPTPKIEELPADGSPAAADFRAPIPYRRIKPEYNDLAYLYEVTATVEVEADLDASGAVTRTEIVRWAGFGLDEAAERAVRKMNWRPAERKGKPLPMRVLLRYNFKKLDRDSPENNR